MKKKPEKKPKKLVDRWAEDKPKFTVVKEPPKKMVDRWAEDPPKFTVTKKADKKTP